MERQTVARALPLSSGPIKFEAVESVNPAPEEGEGGLRRLKFPAADSAWLEQAQPFASIFRDLLYNARTITNSKSAKAERLQAIEDQLDSLRLQYLGWLCSLDTDDDVPSTSDHEVMELIVESLGSIKTSVDGLNSIITGLKGYVL